MKNKICVIYIQIVQNHIATQSNKADIHILEVICRFYGKGKRGKSKKDIPFFQGNFIHGQLEDMPEPLLRAIMDGHSTGTPVVGVVYATEKWSYHQALGMLLLHWAPPKTVCWEDGLEELSKIWDVYDAFKTTNVVWKPYYKDGCPIGCDDERIKVSCYEKENQILAIVATTNKNFNGKAKINSNFGKVTDAISGKVLADNGNAEVELCGFDYKLLVIDK